MKDELADGLGRMLRTEWVRICDEYHPRFRDEKWYELILKHEGVDIDPQAESPDVNHEKYCYAESPYWEGNVVRMPRETALKIIALGFQ